MLKLCWVIFGGIVEVYSLHPLTFAAGIERGTFIPPKNNRYVTCSLSLFANTRQNHTTKTNNKYTKTNKSPYQKNNKSPYTNQSKSLPKKN